MKLNKNTSFVLIYLLSGVKSAAELSQRMPGLSLRSVQRALVKLDEAQIVSRHGVNNPKYSLNYEKVVSQPVNIATLEDIHRPSSAFNFTLLDWLLSDDASILPEIFSQSKFTTYNRQIMTKRDLEYLMIEVSWKSSALEGNTYSLLDTELLMTKGVKAKNKTNFEIQMILNHKSALEFIIDNPKFFRGNIQFAIVEEIHRRLGYNLDIKAGIRRRPVRISASNYEPLVSPAKLRECADSIITVINKQNNPFIKALLAFSLMPYLQPFEDGNKRIGRLLANAILIHLVGRGLHLRNIDDKQLALAYLSFYEFSSLDALAKIFQAEFK